MRHTMTPPARSRRTSVVVGATGGIGSAGARELHARGFALVLHGRREAALAELAAELGAEAVAGDANDETVIAELVARATAGIDVLVHSAGTMHHRSVRQQSAAEFDAILDTNLRSVHVLAHHAVPRMNVGGRILLVSSLAATLKMRGLAAYSASKAGLNAFAGSLAAELEREGINVSLVTPGSIDTAMMDGAQRSYSALPATDAGAVIGWLADLPPRMVVPEILFHAPFRGPYSDQVAGGGPGPEAGAPRNGSA